MRQIKVEKVTLNIGVGGPGDKLEKALKLLKSISGVKPIQRVSMKRIPTWGLRPKLPIAAKVTVRGKPAEVLLKNLLHAVDNKLSQKKFDTFGNFSFGIKEYIDIPGVPYDASIGVIGLEVAVTLARPGFRVKRRAIRPTKLPADHKISKEDAINFMKADYKLEIGDEE
jgi:large subunit ribosomal protein L5